MARYKPNHYHQTQMVMIEFEKQILPGTFEFALHHLIERKLDLTLLDQQYNNDKTGAPAYDPRIMLKIVLFGYSRGLVSSRSIEAACRENVLFMALSGGATPHFTAIAAFVAAQAHSIQPLFQQVLMVCDDMGLIGKEHFAIDGVKLPSNASKQWSGREADFRKLQKKYRAATMQILERHQQQDKHNSDDDKDEPDQRALKRLHQASDKLDRFLEDFQPSIGSGGRERQQNITDPDSAKMDTSHGVIQGYTGVAAVDQQHQIIVHAEAFGSGAEQATLMPMVDGIQNALCTDETLDQAVLTADSGFNSEANVSEIYKRGIDAYLPNHLFRKRDPRFKTAARHEDVRRRKKRQKRQDDIRSERYTLADFHYDAERQICICPQGQRLIGPTRVTSNGYENHRFRGSKPICRACPERARCLRSPDQPSARLVAFFTGRSVGKLNPLMQAKIDTPQGRQIYGQRLGIIEPVFGHLRTHKRLNRFTLRGKVKVNTQWLLYCMVHNLWKIHVNLAVNA